MPMDPKDVKRIAGERLKKMRAEPAKDEDDKPEPKASVHDDKPASAAVTVTVSIPK